MCARRANGTLAGAGSMFHVVCMYGQLHLRLTAGSTGGLLRLHQLHVSDVLQACQQEGRDGSIVGVVVGTPRSQRNTNGGIEQKAITPSSIARALSVTCSSQTMAGATDTSLWMVSAA
jgi:hypothetical protein